LHPAMRRRPAARGARGQMQKSSAGSFMARPRNARDDDIAAATAPTAFGRGELMTIGRERPVAACRSIAGVRESG
jgi:hypothetical protein